MVFPFVVTITLPRGKKKLAISTASSKRPPPLPRRSITNEVIPLFLQFQKGLLKIFRRSAGKSTQIDVTYILIKNGIIRNHRSLDGLTHNIKFQWPCSSFFVRTLHFQLETVLTAPRSIWLTSWLFFPAKSFPSISISISPAFQSDLSCRSSLKRFGYHRTFQLWLYVIKDPMPPPNEAFNICCSSAWSSSG